MSALPDDTWVNVKGDTSLQNWINKGERGEHYEHYL